MTVAVPNSKAHTDQIKAVISSMSYLLFRKKLLCHVLCISLFLDMFYTVPNCVNCTILLNS